MKQYPDEFKASIITKLLAPNNAVPHVTPLIPVPVAPTHEKLFKPGPEAVVQAVREAMG